MKQPIYVFACNRDERETVNGYDSIEVIYRIPKAHKTDCFAPETVTYKGTKYAIVRKPYECGVFYVACIFLN